MADKTFKAVTTDRPQKPTARINTNVVEVFYAVLKWVDLNIVPLLALPALAILAADDIRHHLTHVSNDAALLIGIAIAALLMVKAHK